jgi:Nitrile hydratase beta subunit, C-terminal
MSRFAPGDKVRVLADFARPGHVRTPWYCRGKPGVVERVCGAFRNPEALAYAKDGLPELPLYRVRFAQQALWPDYAGAPGDAVEIEIYEPWLAPAED